MNREVWNSIINGDMEAYSRFYEEFFRKFYNYGKKFTARSSLVEDTIQETFLEIWMSRQRLLHVGSIDSYVFSAFRFKLVRNLQKDRRMVSGEPPETEPGFSAESIIIHAEMNAEMQAKLDACLKALTPRQREAIFLRYYQNFSYEEFADILNISVKASYKIIARSLSVMRSGVAVFLVMSLLRNSSEKFF